MKAPLLRPDGSFNIDRIGLKPSWSRDIYHFLLTTSWRSFLFIQVGFYLLVNFLFACVYAIEPHAISNAHQFSDLFYFSVQTTSTVGYGGMAPQTDFAHLVMVVQLVFGFVLTAISTGMVFAKFSQVRARVLFSQQALIHMQENRAVLTFRCANQRSSQILDASVRLTLTRDEMVDGRRMRRFYTLPLVRDSTPLFALVWNVYHVIDENSPFWGLQPDDLAENMAALLVTFSGMDEALTQAMHTRHAYNAQDVMFQTRFKDILGDYPNGRRYIDYRDFHMTLPAPAPLPWQA